MRILLSQPIKVFSPLLVSRTTSFLVICVLLASCYVAEPHAVSAPNIASNSYWKIITGCGYEHCGPPPVDYLVGKDVRLQLLFQHDEKNQFVIGMSIVPQENATIELDTSFVIERPQKEYYATAYECGRDVWNPLFREAITPVRKLIAKEKDKCAVLFFPMPIPPVDEKFRMRIPDVVINGVRMEVPVITFTKAVRVW
jgi:hypothetical protein